MGPAPPFFIVGTPRSGTSILHGMLAAHSRVCVPPETFLFSKVLPRARRYVRRGHIVDRDGFRAALAGSRELEPILRRLTDDAWEALWKRESTVCGLLGGILDAYAEASGKTRWGEKTPSHLWYWRHIDRCFSQSRFLTVVRDGRDVVASLSAVPWGTRNVWAGAYRWRREVRAVESLHSTLGPSRAHTVAYEDLVGDPSGTIAQVCGFLGLDFQPAMLEMRVNPEEYIHSFEQGWKAGNRKPLYRSSIGAHRKRFSANDVRRLTIVMYPELRRLGYVEPAQAGTGGGTLLRLGLGAYGFLGFVARHGIQALKRHAW
jgi:hypothetical protein